MIKGVLILNAFLLLGCGDVRRSGSSDSSSGAVSGHSAIDSVRLAGDTGIVTADAPTVIAVFPTSKGSTEESPDEGEALDDFLHTVSTLRDTLDKVGVHLVVRLDEPVEVASGDKRFTWEVPDDSGGVGYLFVTPGRSAKAVWGLHTNVELLPAAEAYFAPSSRTKRARSRP